MKYATCMTTAIGGLSLLLILSGCSSGSKQKTADTAAQQTAKSASPQDSASPQTPNSASPQTADTASQRPAGASVPPSDLPRSDVVTDRGSSRRVTDTADAKRLADGWAAIAKACPSQKDAQGNVVFDDPSCPDRYRRQMANISSRDLTLTGNDLVGLPAACPSKVDTQGNVVFDDPGCPLSYRRQIAEKELAEIAAACPSQADASGRIVYQDPACPDRHRRQKDDRAVLVSGCPSRVDASGKVIYEDPACPARNRYLAQENAFYDRYADKAVKHARAAEIAGNQGNVADLVENAQLSLDHAKEARRAGNNADLAAGILALRQAIAYGQGNEVFGAASSIREARVRLARAAGMKTWNEPPPFATPVKRIQTVRGELARNDRAATGVSGGEQYIVRDPQNHEVPIALSPEMSQQVQLGDMVEAQVDSEGHVTSIMKAK